jgi:Protein of unknown function (DUF1549)/Protein of unknown function (DUF1553)
MPALIPPLPRTWLIILAFVFCVQRALAGPVSFRNDVMAVLSKAGCNQGTCHGNQNGKNGFKLSLRGENPDFDFVSLSRDMLGRRVDRLRPAESLLLLKPTAAIPHEGGKRFALDSQEYAILKQWIAAGLPADSPATPRLVRIQALPAEQVLIQPADRAQLRVQATFADGSVRDITRLAVYEVANDIVTVSASGLVERQQPGETTILVRYLDRRATVQLAFVPARPNFRWQPVPERNYIDHLVFSKLWSVRLLPSPLCSDSVFLRRAYLDTLGMLPTVAEARAFLSDPRADKRRRLIDRLLERPEFADYWALKWSDLLHLEEKALDPKGVGVFHHWIRQWLADGKPLNEFARQLIAARGSTYANPPANFYRALRDPQARAEAVAQVFLGIRLQCARCHNHPFDRWTQDDYHSLAAFFARIDYKIVENRRKDRLDKHQFDGDQIVLLSRTGEVNHPRTHASMHPHLLDGPDAARDAAFDRLQVLADWVAAPENPFFARAQANRIWFHLLGRGIVEPNDDFRATNPPANAPLLDALARDLAEHHFDLRHLIRQIMNARTYQLAATPNDTNLDDEANFSHALVRPLPAEPLLDALAEALEVPVRFNVYPLGTRAVQLPGVRLASELGQRPTTGEEFLQRFGKPERLLGCECERSEDITLSQAFQLLTGSLVNDMLSTPANRLGRLLALGRSDKEIVEELYLATLSRYPTPQEMQGTLGIVARGSERRRTLEDVLWGLISSKEFLLRH